MQCLQAPVSDLSVLERQRLHFDFQQQQQGQEEEPIHHSFDADLCVQSLNSFACFSNGLPDLAQYSLPVASNFEEAGVVAVSNSKQVSNSKRRKVESSPKSKQESSRDESNCKRVKQETGGGGGGRSESRQQNNRKEASGDTSNKNEEHPKADYIHVRARRGQATDSHSLAERVRRERISQRMKYLQELVPGCSKITGKAGMLDEIINYVQSLQRQVEFLSMKLAAVNPLTDINISSEAMDHPFLHFNSIQAHPCSGLDMFLDSSSDLMPDGSPFVSCSALNSLYGVEFQLSRSGTAAFPFQSFQGNLLPNNLKMEEI